MVIGQILGVEKVVATLGSKQPKVVEALKAQVGTLTVMLMGYVKSAKLTGQVLHVQTGRLRRSITRKVTIDRTLVSGLVGTNVAYARAHEFGIDMHKMVTVRAYVRQCKSRNAYGIKRGGAVRDGSGKTIARMLKRVVTASGVANVKSFQRNQHIKLKERSFLRSSLEDKASDIRANLQMAIREALR